ncbi:hypothetical protein KY284_030171 [Solanum tuberosum]|nr:hypothetical protein KY284_030171 [Solanum tuberosum]
MLPHDPPYRLQAVPRVHMSTGFRKTEELELKKTQQETKAIKTSRKVIPSMWQEMCKKQLMIANSDFMENMEKKFLNLVSKLEEKDNAITTLMLLAQQFAEVKRKEMEQGTPPSLLSYTNNFRNNNLAFPVKPVRERRIVTVTVFTISGETCYKAGDNMMNYSTGNKTTTLININDVPHNVGEGFLHARTSR